MLDGDFFTRLARLKEAFDAQDVDRLKEEFKVKDNYSFSLYGSEGDDFEIRETLWTTVTTDFDTAANGCEWFRYVDS